MKIKVKRGIDILMTLALLFVSGYQLWGETAHEWAGAGMFILFIAHHLLNLGWYKNLSKGNYTPFRILQLTVNLLLFAVMLMQMYSGIVLSRHVFDFLSFSQGLSLARQLHILGAYWGFLLMSFHLGLHWNMILTSMKKKMPAVSKSRTGLRLGSAAGLLIAGYGLVVFIKRDFPTYLFLRSEFVFLDYDEPAMLFYLDYLALMGLCIFLAHHIGKLCRRGTKKR